MVMCEVANVGDVVRAQVDRHEVRLDELERLVVANPGSSTYDLAAGLTWSRPWDQIGPMLVGAVAETAAHVEMLVRTGELVRDAERLRAGALFGLGH